ncbi:hypothetical protein DEJ13_09755 [Curtobacterium sp. MCLR17_007]|uniref:hypothetical protein n=1 Tax=Curtobacterium sp. MCLR17_007 TaxID=2175648 RepID=UPI000DA83CC2|nr:hypothetical protein [Curtobacterium sp. MCLR17_007]WIB58758.1 hypothetical protein DEJ13_09755 [Curtobacterium sp. MCLR17_007]
MGALSERGDTWPLAPSPAGHMRDDIVPHVRGRASAADETDGPIQVWAVGDEPSRPDGFLWCGGADAGGFLAAPDRGLAADQALSLVAERLRSSRGSGVPTGATVTDLVAELAATSEPSVTTMTVLRERLAASARPDLPPVQRIAAALSTWVQQGAERSGARLRGAAATAAHVDRTDHPGRVAVLGSMSPMVAAIPFGLVGGWSPEQAFTEFGLFSAPADAWSLDVVAGAATAAVLRAVTDGADLSKGLRETSALLHRLQQPSGATVDAALRAAAARARERSDHGAVLMAPSGTSDVDALSVAVSLVLSRPEPGGRSAAIALAEASGADAACVVRVLLAALRGAGPDAAVPADVRAVAQRLASG